MIEKVLKKYLAKENLQKMINGFEISNGLIEEIADASKDQNDGADLINNAIRFLRKFAQTNAENAEHMSASAEELNVQAFTLSETVSYFKT